MTSKYKEPTESTDGSQASLAVGADRRAEPRTPTTGVTTTIIPFAEQTPQTAVSVAVQDVSAHGIGLLSPVALTPGEEFVLPQPLEHTNADGPAVTHPPGRAFKVMRSKPAADGKYFIGAQALFEPLEGRQMMSVSLNSAGFTVVTPAADSRVIYVSSSQGSDANTGLSPSSPFKTIAKGETLLRDGAPDELLLKRGDTWHESFGAWTKSGRSHDDPMVIGNYGTGERPLVATGTGTGLNAGTSSHPNVNHLDIIGVHLWADGRDPSVAGYNKSSNAIGLRLVAGGGDYLIEDTEVQGYETNIVLGGGVVPVTNVTIRRSVVVDAYSAGADHSQGLYAEMVHGLTLQDNVFDHNGWNPTVPGAVATIFNHDAYLTGTTDGVVVTDNIFANASSHGLQARGGGIVENNLFINDPIGLSYGLVNGGGHIHVGGVTGRVVNNVIIGGRDINGQARGEGIELGNTAVGGGTVVSGNVVADYPAGMFAGISLTSGIGTYQADQVGLNDLTITNNVIYQWATGISLGGGLFATGTGYKSMHNVTVQDNDFSQTKTPFFSGTSQFAAKNPGPTTAYPAPSRTVATYDASIGDVGSIAGFLAHARAQSNQSWSPQYTAHAAADYIRAGFGMSPTGPTTTPAPVPAPTPAPTPTPAVPAPTPAPVPAPTPATAPTPAASAPTAALSRLTLINAAGNTSLGTLTDGQVIDFAKNGIGNQLNVQANANAGVGSVVFTLDGSVYHTENFAPFMLGGDTGGVANAWTPELGAHLLVATPFSGPNGTGTAGKAIKLHFRVVDSAPSSSNTSEPTESGGSGATAEPTITPSAPEDAETARANGHTMPPIFGVATSTVPKGRHPAVNATPPVAKPAAATAKRLVVRRVAIEKLGHDRVQIKVHFSQDVGTSLETSDLRLVDATGTAATPTSSSLQYDAATHTAKWTVTGLGRGRYQVRLAGATIENAQGQALDGDRDGQGGGDFASHRRLRIRQVA